MKIGVDASCWVNRRGYGRFARELLKAMILADEDHEYIFFIDSVSRPACTFPDGVAVRSVPVSRSAAEAASSTSRRSVRDMYNMGRAVFNETLDIMFFPSVYTYFPIFTSVKNIVTIHDVIPEQFPKLVFPNWRLKFFWRLKLWAALKQADQILTVSAYSKQGIIDHFGFDADRIKVVYEAAESIFRPTENNKKHQDILKKYGLKESDRFFLYVGGIGPHKNLDALLFAFLNILQRLGMLNLKLLIIGDFKTDSFWIDSQLLDKAKKIVAENHVQFPGYVPDSDLVHLYTAAEALVLPSFSEGFGLPAVEAMACGTAVIGSQTTSLPEIVREAGIFFDPHNISELTNCLERVIQDRDLKQNLESKGREIAASYTWQKSAHNVLSIFTELVSS